MLWIERFDMLEQLRTRLPQFARDYDERWLLERDGYRRPAKPAKRSVTRSWLITAFTNQLSG